MVRSRNRKDVEIARFYGCLSGTERLANAFGRLFQQNRPVSAAILPAASRPKPTYNYGIERDVTCREDQCRIRARAVLHAVGLELVARLTLTLRPISRNGSPRSWPYLLPNVLSAYHGAQVQEG